MTVDAGEKTMYFTDPTHLDRRHSSVLIAINTSFCLSVLAGGLKCPVCSFVYGTKWEFNRHLKNKHGLKVVEIDGDPKWEVTL